MNVLERIRQARGSLTSSQRKIADYVLGHLEEAAFASSVLIARRVGVSESTVTRFAQALGFDGFPALKEALRESLLGRLRTTDRMELSPGSDGSILFEALRKDLAVLNMVLEGPPLREFSLFVEELSRARVVYVLANRSTYALGYYFYFYMGWLGRPCRLLSGRNELYESLLSASSEDVLLAMTFPRYYRESLEGVRLARGLGVRVLLITDDYMSPAAGFADHVLPVPTDFVSFVDSPVAPMSVINALVVAIASRGGHAVRRRFEELERVWKEEKVYLEEGWS